MGIFLVRVTPRFKEMDSIVYVSECNDITDIAIYNVLYLNADPDPCLADPCDTNADCTRESLTTGTFSCVCRIGFTGSGFECSGTCIYIMSSMSVHV